TVRKSGSPGTGLLSRQQKLLGKPRRQMAHERAYCNQYFLCPFWRVAVFYVHRGIAPRNTNAIQRSTGFCVELLVRHAAASVKSPIDFTQIIPPILLLRYGQRGRQSFNSDLANAHEMHYARGPAL